MKLVRWNSKLSEQTSHTAISVSSPLFTCSQYADQLYGPELTHNEDSPQGEEDVATALAQEVEKLRGSSEQSPRRFQAINSGAKHVVFIKCQPPVDPVELVHYILSDVMKTKQHKSRCATVFCL